MFGVWGSLAAKAQHNPGFDTEMRVQEVSRDQSRILCPSLIAQNQSAPKERRRRRAEKRLSKRVFLESPFLLFPTCGLLLKHMKTLRGQRGNGLSKNTLLDDRCSARRLRRSFGAPPQKYSKTCGLSFFVMRIR